MKLRKNSTTRLLRGGGINIDVASGFLRVTFRSSYLPEGRDREVSFRYVIRGQK